MAKGSMRPNKEKRKPKAEKNKKKLYPKSKNWASPGSHFEDLGFRCVRQLPAPAAEKY